jgi:hypothetical protein
MKSHELVRSLLENRNAKELAAAMNLSLSSIYKWAEPSEGGSGTPNPLDRIEQLIEATGDPSIAQWVCEKAGGFFVNNPHVSGERSFDSVIVATNQIVQEFAQTLSLIATAASDNSLTREEACEIRSRWQELKTAAEEFVNLCEQGNFAPTGSEKAGYI